MTIDQIDRKKRKSRKRKLNRSLQTTPSPFNETAKTSRSRPEQGSITTCFDHHPQENASPEWVSISQGINGNKFEISQEAKVEKTSLAFLAKIVLNKAIIFPPLSNDEKKDAVANSILDTLLVKTKSMINSISGDT